MNKKYSSILKYNKAIHDAARSVISQSDRSVFDTVTASVSAPVLYMYVSYIIDTAVRKGIKTIWFMARDGYSLLRIAAEICTQKKLGISCRYLYCSRHSLRMAAYRFKDSSAYSRLFYEAYFMTAESFFQRAEFDENDMRIVCDDIGYPFSDIKKQLSGEEFRQFCGKIKGSDVFDDILTNRSDKAYELAVKYFRQEGLADEKLIAVADLGWTGSMQLALKKLLQSDGINTPVYGFYLGLLENPPIYENCIYDGWLFDGKGSPAFKAAFSHNLMECICTAPHGMTMGYEYKDNRIVPVIAMCENDTELIQHQSDIIFAITKHMKGYSYDNRHRRLAMKLLRAFLFKPTREEAEAFSKYRFCDDVSEGYHKKLAEECSCERIMRSLIHTKLFWKKKYEPLFWFCGSLARSSCSFKWLWRAEYYFYNMLRYFIKGL